MNISNIKLSIIINSSHLNSPKRYRKRSIFNINNSLELLLILQYRSTYSKNTILSICFATREFFLSSNLIQNLNLNQLITYWHILIRFRIFSSNFSHNKLLRKILNNIRLCNKREIPFPCINFSL